MANFRYIRPSDVGTYSVTANRQQASYPASNIALIDKWQRSWRTPDSTAGPTLTLDFGGPIAPRAFFFNKANFGLVTVERSSDGVSFTSEAALTLIEDDRVGRIKTYFDVTHGAFRYWRFSPIGIVGDMPFYELGSLLVAAAVQEFSDGPKPPLEWEPIDAASETPMVAGGDDVNLLSDEVHLRYPNFGSDVHRKLVGTGKAQWREVINFGRSQGFLIAEPVQPGVTSTPYAYFVRRVGEVSVPEFLVTFATILTLEEKT